MRLIFNCFGGTISINSPKYDAVFAIKYLSHIILIWYALYDINANSDIPFRIIKFMNQIDIICWVIKCRFVV